MTTSQWTIELLGPFCVRRDELVHTRFRTHKTGAMLAYLASYPERTIRREELIDLFWPDNEVESGRNCLRIALSAIRRIFHPEDNEPFGTPAALLADRDHVRLNPITFSTDKFQFESCLLKAMRSENLQERTQWLKRGLDFYRSDLLPGYDEPWIQGERQRLIDARLLAMRRLVALLVKMQDIPAALDFAHRAVETDPLREESQRMLIQLYAAMGQPTDALRQYQSLEQRMLDQLGCRPSAATRALVTQLTENSIGSDSGSRVTTLISGNMGSSNGSSRMLPARTQRIGNLPVPYSQFFGHEDCIAQLIEMLETPQTRLVTITGLAGSGKTRLALAVGEKIRESLSGAVWFVSLADLTLPGQIHSAIARAMELPCHAALPIVSQIAQALGSLPALLILDNFEHLIAKGNTAIVDLLEAVPNLMCVVTSRQRLNIAGEYEYAVSPLPTPVAMGTPDRLMEFPSVQLFVDRAQAVRPLFRITRENAPAIANLCHHLEGVPLAIELAAAYVQVLSPAQIFNRLTKRFTLLVNRNKSAPERHASLHAALDWSYRLLDPPLQRFFARLSTLHGGWTLEAAEAICTDTTAWVEVPVERQKALKTKGPAYNKTATVSLLPFAYRHSPFTLQALIELRERSIIQAVDDHDVMRYQMLETLREFAEEKLDPKEVPNAHLRHGHFFLALAEQAEPYLIGSDTAQWLNRLQTEYANFHAALQFFLNPDTEAHLLTQHEGLRLAGALGRFWHVRGYYQEGQEWLQMALQCDPQAPAALRLKGLLGLGNIAFEADQREISEKAYQDLLTLAEQENDKPSMAAALCGLGNLAKMQGNLATARALREESLLLCQEAGDLRGMALNSANLANVLMTQGEALPAKQLYQQSLDLFRSLKDVQNIVLSLNNLAYTLQSLEEKEQAYACLVESLTLSRQIENKFGFIHAIINLVSLYEGARFAIQATRLLACAAACMEQLMIPDTHDSWTGLENERAKLHMALGDSEFTENWKYGLTISIDQAIQLVQDRQPDLRSYPFQ